MDWGNTGLHLKRRKPFEELKEDDFAIFLGMMNNEVILGIKSGR